MSGEAAGSVWVELVRPVLDAFMNRGPAQAAHHAGELAFWRDGMLKQLASISEGNLDEKIFADLKQAYDSTEVSAENAMEKLKHLRGKLGASRISEHIDSILNDAQYGKMMIRSRIDNLIQHHAHYGPESTIEQAAGIKCDIEILNAELQRLHRLVYPPA